MLKQGNRYLTDNGPAVFDKHGNLAGGSDCHRSPERSRKFNECSRVQIIRDRVVLSGYELAGGIDVKRAAQRKCRAAVGKLHRYISASRDVDYSYGNHGKKSLRFTVYSLQFTVYSLKFT